MADQDADPALLALRWTRSQRAVRLLLRELDDRAEQLERTRERLQAVAQAAEALRRGLAALPGARELLAVAEDAVGLALGGPVRRRVEVSDFTVAELFATLEVLFRPLLDDGRTLIFEARRLPSLRTDEGKLAHVLRNFIAVVLRYTRRGHVVVLAEPADGDRVAFTVTDTRVAAEEAADARRDRLVAGSLRLDVVRDLAEALDGEVALDHPSSGVSTFSLVIPRVLAPPVAEPGPAPSGDATVLVVEDDEATVYLYDRYLRGSGFAMRAARTLDDARAALASRPAVVVLDLLLEREATWAFLAELRRRADTRDVPVLMATVLEGGAHALDAGVDEFHTKPLAQAELLEGLKRLAQRGAPTRVLAIDADPSFARRLRELLGDRFRVTAAPAGPEAARRAAEEEPAVVVLGPSASGLDLPGDVARVRTADELEGVAGRLRGGR